MDWIHQRKRNKGSRTQPHTTALNMSDAVVNGLCEVIRSFLPNDPHEADRLIDEVYDKYDADDVDEEKEKLKKENEKLKEENELWRKQQPAYQEQKTLNEYKKMAEEEIKKLKEECKENFDESQKWMGLMYDFREKWGTLQEENKKLYDFREKWVLETQRTD